MTIHKLFILLPHVEYMLPETKKCNRCNTIKSIEDFYIASKGTQKEHPWYICRECQKIERKEWRERNKEKVKESRKRWYKKHHDENSISKNPSCPLYLGYHISETVLSHVFKNVTRMPITNPGYDFTCSRNKKIDVKSSCICKRSVGPEYWQFTIKRNQIPDYFILLAFDNLENLNPKHIWLVPSKLINSKLIIYIGNTNKSIRKWSKYELPIDKTKECCSHMKKKKSLPTKKSFSQIATSRAIIL